MTARYLTVDWAANIYEITNLVDQFGHDTQDPALASTCVIKLANDQWLPRDATDIPIYTVH